MEIASREPGREHRRLTEAAAWRAVARIAARLGRAEEARTAAGNALDLFRAALLPSSPELRDRERELDRVR